MPISTKDLHACELASGTWWLRTPTAHDVPKIRRVLSQQGIRRPMPIEFRVAALAGLDALGEQAGDPGEAERQKAIVRRWHELLVPTDENDIDIADFEDRAKEIERLEEARIGEMNALLAEYSAIEANLRRHWPPYRELVADKDYWDDISQIEAVRQLLVRRDEQVLPRAGDGMLTHEAYLAIPTDERPALAMFATRLLSPGEAARKN